MFDKKYILWKLSFIFMFDMSEEEFIEFWLDCFDMGFYEDIWTVIKATRELTRNHKFYVEEYKKWKEKKLLNSNNWKDEK